MDKSRFRKHAQDNDQSAYARGGWLCTAAIRAFTLRTLLSLNGTYR